MTPSSRPSLYHWHNSMTNTGGEESSEAEGWVHSDSLSMVSSNRKCSTAESKALPYSRNFKLRRGGCGWSAGDERSEAFLQHLG